MIVTSPLPGTPRVRRAVLPAVLVALLVALAAVPGATPARAASCPSASTSVNYSGGSGLEADPWQISTAADVLRLADPSQSGDWSGYFLQTADIDLAGCDWTPIAFSQTPWAATNFTGTYDGGGWSLRNMSFDDSTGLDYVGMFGAVDGATIADLSLHVRIRSSGSTTGALVGMGRSGGVSVRDVDLDVDMVLQDGNAGGMIGESGGPVRIERSSVTGIVSVVGVGATYDMGGLVGQYYGSAPEELLVSESESSADVTSTSTGMDVGGVVGGAYGPTRISDTSVGGSLSGAKSVGGIIGYLNAADAFVIRDVRVTASGVAGVTGVGGLVGDLVDVDTLSIERAFVRAPVSASLELGGCVIGAVASGMAENVTSSEAYSRSTLTVAGTTTQCPFPTDPEPAGPSFVAPGGVVPSAPVGSGEWVQADGSSVPLVVSSPGRNQVRYVADGVQVTFTGGAGSDVSRGLVADQNGEVVCEICLQWAAGQVIEVWMFSEPRLVAAHLTQDLPCQRFSVPVVSPLDGGGQVVAGAHTLQLALPTASGMQAVNVGVTVGGPVPGSVPAGEGPAAGGRPGVPAGGMFALALALVAGGVLVSRRRVEG